MKCLRFWKRTKYLNTQRNPVIFILVLLADCIISKCTRKVKKIVKEKKKKEGKVAVSGRSPKNAGNVSTRLNWNQ